MTRNPLPHYYIENLEQHEKQTTYTSKTFVRAKAYFIVGALSLAIVAGLAVGLVSVKAKLEACSLEKAPTFLSCDLTTTKLDATGTKCVPKRLGGGDVGGGEVIGGGDVGGGGVIGGGEVGGGGVIGGGEVGGGSGVGVGDSSVDAGFITMVSILGGLLAVVAAALLYSFFGPPATLAAPSALAAPARSATPPVPDVLPESPAPAEPAAAAPAAPAAAAPTAPATMGSTSTAQLSAMVEPMAPLVVAKAIAALREPRPNKKNRRSQEDDFEIYDVDDPDVHDDVTPSVGSTGRKAMISAAGTASKEYDILSGMPVSNSTQLNHFDATPYRAGGSDMQSSIGAQLFSAAVYGLMLTSSGAISGHGMIGT